jgi:hypothetical protein
MLTITTSATDITGTWRWSAAPEGQDIKGRWDDGDLNGVSIGFRPIRSVPRPNGGLHYQTWELVELSVVSIPACASCLALRQACACHHPERSRPMRQDPERFDIDEALVRDLVRAVVQQQLMQVTGRLDAGAPPRRRQPAPAAKTLEVLGWERTPSSRWQAWQQQGFDYAAMERTFRGHIDNSALAELARRPQG